MLCIILLLIERSILFFEIWHPGIGGALVIAPNDGNKAISKVEKGKLWRLGWARRWREWMIWDALLQTEETFTTQKFFFLPLHVVPSKIHKWGARSRDFYPLLSLLSFSTCKEIDPHVHSKKGVRITRLGDGGSQMESPLVASVVQPYKAKNQKNLPHVM